MNADKPHKLYFLLLILGVAALLGVFGIYLRTDTAHRTTLLIEIAKGLIQILGIGIIGALVKFLFDDYWDRRQRADKLKALEQQRNEALQEFRLDKIKRLVLVTNVLRRAPVLIDAHRSAKTYNQQMRALLDARLELRLLRHEINAAGPGVNPAFPRWPEIRDQLRKMEDYVAWLEKDFRKNSKGISELQLEAEKDRSRQGAVWERIRQLESVGDLLNEIDAQSKTTEYYQQYQLNYEATLDLMTRASLQVEA